MTTQTQAPTKRHPKHGQPLTPRETQVAKLLAEGNKGKAVAAVLGLSQKTVDAHKTTLMGKLDIHNRVQLVVWAMRTGLVAPVTPAPQPKPLEALVGDLLEALTAGGTLEPREGDRLTPDAVAAIVALRSRVPS